MAAMTTQLAWGAISFKNGYISSGQLDYVYECLKWATDYFIEAYHLDTMEFIGQVSKANIFHHIFKLIAHFLQHRLQMGVLIIHIGEDLKKCPWIDLHTTSVLPILDLTWQEKLLLLLLLPQSSMNLMEILPQPHWP